MRMVDLADKGTTKDGQRFTSRIFGILVGFHGRKMRVEYISDGGWLCKVQELVIIIHCIPDSVISHQNVYRSFAYR
jgi:hypothetical protein